MGWLKRRELMRAGRKSFFARSEIGVDNRTLLRADRPYDEVIAREHRKRIILPVARTDANECIATLVGAEDRCRSRRRR